MTPDSNSEFVRAERLCNQETKDTDGRLRRQGCPAVHRKVTALLRLDALFTFRPQASDIPHIVGNLGAETSMKSKHPPPLGTRPPGSLVGTHWGFPAAGGPAHRTLEGGAPPPTSAGSGVLEGRGQCRQGWPGGQTICPQLFTVDASDVCSWSLTLRHNMGYRRLRTWCAQRVPHPSPGLGTGHMLSWSLVFPQVKGPWKEGPGGPGGSTRQATRSSETLPALSPCPSSLARTPVPESHVWEADEDADGSR